MIQWSNYINLQTILQIEKLWGRRRLSRKIWVPSFPDVSLSQHFFLWYTKVNFLFYQSKAAPSKAFLEDQAERDPSERERAEKERAKRELAKRQKLQSYEDFEPISISELDCVSFFSDMMVILTRNLYHKLHLQNVKLKDFERKECQKTCYPRYNKVW